MLFNCSTEANLLEVAALRAVAVVDCINVVLLLALQPSVLLGEERRGNGWIGLMSTTSWASSKARSRIVACVPCAVRWRSL